MKRFVLYLSLLALPVLSANPTFADQSNVCNETLKKRIVALAEFATTTRSYKPAIALSREFKTLVQMPELSGELDAILKPLISKPTFLKNSLYFDSFSAVTRARIQKQWGYASPTSEDLVLNIDFFSSSEDYESNGMFCGTCDDMPPAFFSTLKKKMQDVDSSQSILVKAGRAPIGLIKKDGTDPSFLALRNVRNKKGELILVKGGVYAVHTDFESYAWRGSLNINSVPFSERRFYPLTFMRSVDKEFTPTEFKSFLEMLDQAVQAWSPKPTRPRAETPRYLTDWTQAKDKEKYLNSLSSSPLALTLIARWSEIQSAEQFLSKLESNHLKSVLLKKWSAVSEPEKYLAHLNQDDLFEIMIPHWATLKNPDQYIEQFQEYDFGKILTANWYRVENPERYLGLIQDEYLRQLILRTKE